MNVWVQGHLNIASSSSQLIVEEEDHISLKAASIDLNA